ncbi:acylphosphatase, putative [Babesia bigemina]|uniref:acylphosphatase n=1 Tax=Babesia bigemina TaxID=5866 RepID=A0A061D237_BABBI|nr:acylphosphatase, putative [Babesia bigemina]CDR94688.1 acylphosphatase, putative [Babesia bigemina]|eukprot:XP_012766874.1 acylphosphatase, putative [Babesia bigemina]
MSPVFCAKFRVSGRVQGVFFRKFTKEAADRLGIKGFVRNEADGTVSGEGQSHSLSSMDDFRHFLEKVGSPNSEILSCDFKMTEKSGDLEYNSFDIIR